MFKAVKAACCTLLIMAPLLAGAQAEERALSHRSEIEVFADSSMVVKETVRVVSTGDRISHGIYRDFPLAYRDSLGHRYLVGFRLLAVTRDGMPEPYRTQRSGNGQRIYIGREDAVIPQGEHEYAITYKTERQLGFFEDHDELYWNTTGNGWDFPIESATARVKLPGNIAKDKISTALYTGAQGSTAQEGTARIADDGTIEFAAARPLGPGEGLTIVVGWPKGVVAPPTPAQGFWAAVRANADYIIGISGFFLVLAFYAYMWHKRGRDPKKGSIIALYEQPRGFSPALLRYIRRMGSDNRAFASAIIDLAIKGRLTVAESKGLFHKTNYTLTKKNNASPAALPPEEELLVNELFAEGNSLALDSKNAAKISKIRENFSRSLKDQAGKQYFAKNTLVVAAGIFLSAVVLAGAIMAAVAVRFSVDSILTILFWPTLFLALVAVNAIFGWLVRAYTPEGRKLADEIEGFKLFLTVTEKDRLAFHNPPEKTPELFEKMLPYALALGVEHEWAGQFADMFARLEQQGLKYAPAWYYGSVAHFSADNFASAMGNSFTGAVASASAPPGSGSGFSGGSSGGGGGGGGGGGW